MFALIEITYGFIDGANAYRICEIQNNTFPVAEQLIWIECDTSTSPQTHLYDGKKFILYPQEVILETPAT